MEKPLSNSNNYVVFIGFEKWVYQSLIDIVCNKLNDLIGMFYKKDFDKSNPDNSYSELKIEPWILTNRHKIFFLNALNREGTVSWKTHSDEYMNRGMQKDYKTKDESGKNLPVENYFL